LESRANATSQKKIGNQLVDALERRALRNYDESCVLLDQIVGRCIRDVGFATSVLRDPEAALKEYELNEDELDDFRALKDRHYNEAAEGWAAIRTGLEIVLNRQQTRG
jgi:hypothetical protein